MIRIVIRALIMVVVLLLLSCEREVSVSDISYSFSGYLNIDSNPDGCKIFINGKNSGYITPQTNIMIESGANNIVLKKQYYKDYLFELYVEEEDSIYYFADFYSDPSVYGSILCKSTPKNSQIIFDGDTTSFFTDTLLSKIEPGTHSLQYFAEGYRCKQKSVQVFSDSTTSLYLQLEDTTSIVTYNDKYNNFGTDFFSSIVTDENGSIWIGSLEGLFNFNNGKFSKFTKSNSVLDSDMINHLSKSKYGGIWVCTANGLYKILKGHIRKYGNWDDLNNTFITSIVEKKNGEVIIGTKEGVFEELAGEFSRLEIINFTGNYISSLALNTRGMLLIGSTSWGLGIYYEDEFYIVTTNEKDGLSIPGNSIYTICIDKNDDFWISCKEKKNKGAITESGGICKFDGHRMREFSNFKEVMDFNINEDNSIWLASTYGLYYMDTNYGFKHYYNLGGSFLKNLSGITDDADNLWVTTQGEGIKKIKTNFFDGDF